ncbi:MAG TPA: hypothetical protein VFS43_24705 [Polyangiaceae bacterium]|nr:hypothetical protein [Polyangiaceae bacterium]
MGLTMDAVGSLSLRAGDDTTLAASRSGRAFQSAKVRKNDLEASMFTLRH